MQLRCSWLALLAGLAGTVAAADIQVSNNWSRSVTRADLATGFAGSDIATQLPSVAGVATITISNAESTSWTVRVSKSDIQWPPGATVFVRRSGNEGGISGGSDYMELSGSAQDFFSGTGNHSVQIQLKIEGVTLQTPPDTAYSLTITYTVE